MLSSDGQKSNRIRYTVRSIIVKAVKVSDERKQNRQHPQQAFQQLLDARGLECPLPLLKTRLALKNLNDQDILLVRATDGGSRQDIPRYLANSPYELLSVSDDQNEYCFFIKKRWNLN